MVMPACAESAACSIVRQGSSAEPGFESLPLVEIYRSRDFGVVTAGSGGEKLSPASEIEPSHRKLPITCQRVILMYTCAIKSNSVRRPIVSHGVPTAPAVF